MKGFEPLTLALEALYSTRRKGGWGRGSPATPIASFTAGVTQNLKACVGTAAISTDVGNDRKHFSVTLMEMTTHTHTHTHTHELAEEAVSSDDPHLVGVGYLRIRGVFVITGLLPAFAGTDDLENPNCLFCIFQVYS